MHPKYKAEQSPFQQLVMAGVARLVAIFWKMPGPLGVCVTSKIRTDLSQKVAANIGMEGLVIHLILDALSARDIDGSSLMSAL